jgi:hypothetical protein
MKCTPNVFNIRAPPTTTPGHSGTGIVRRKSSYFLEDGRLGVFLMEKRENLPFAWTISSIEYQQSLANLNPLDQYLNMEWRGAVNQVKFHGGEVF